MGFVFKFGSNWTNFDVSTPFLIGRGWCSVRARKVSEMASGLTSLSLTLIRTVYPRYNGRHTAGTDALSKNERTPPKYHTPAITDHHQNTGPDAFLEILIPAPIQIISAIPDS